MMKANLKRKVTLSMMGLMVIGAVVLNWMHTSEQGQMAASQALDGVAQEDVVTQPHDDVAGQTVLVSSGDDALDSQESAQVATTTDDYFAAARLTRQQARDSAVSLLQQAAAQEDAGEEVANEASESIQVLASFTMSETQIENLVTAKGYADCVVFMGEESVSVVVSTTTGELSETDVAKISDITMTETGYQPHQIKIVAAN